MAKRGLGMGWRLFGGIGHVVMIMYDVTLVEAVIYLQFFLFSFLMQYFNTKTLVKERASSGVLEWEY